MRRRGRVLALVLAVGGGAGACERRGGGPASDPVQRAVQEARNAYLSRDAVPASAFTWIAPDSTIFVLVDVESGIEGVTQARADLWMAGAGTTARLARSDVMPSAATIGAFAFADLTGDGLPDLLGYVQDSAGTAFPIFLPGARGMLVDELQDAAAGFRLMAEPEQAPSVVSGPRGPCALEFWAEAPAPDSQPAGWRYLALLPGGRLGKPALVAPTCR